MFLLEIQTIVRRNTIVELCKNDLVSAIVESESPKIMIPFCTSILSALVILPIMLLFNQWRKSHIMKILLLDSKTSNDLKLNLMDKIIANTLSTGI